MSVAATVAVVPETVRLTVNVSVSSTSVSSVVDTVKLRVSPAVPDLILVAAPERRRLFGELTVSPPLFTPNGDGVNDAATLSFDLLLVRGSSPVEAHLFDLGGRRVRVLSGQRPVSTGSWELRWDGRGEGGELVPPGIYTVLLKVDAYVAGAGLDRARTLRAVAVAY